MTRSNNAIRQIGSFIVGLTWLPLLNARPLCVWRVKHRNACVCLCCATHRHSDTHTHIHTKAQSMHACAHARDARTHACASQSTDQEALALQKAWVGQARDRPTAQNKPKQHVHTVTRKKTQTRMCTPRHVVLFSPKTLWVRSKVLSRGGGMRTAGGWGTPLTPTLLWLRYVVGCAEQDAASAQRRRQTECQKSFRQPTRGKKLQKRRGILLSLSICA